MISLRVFSACVLVCVREALAPPATREVWLLSLWAKQRGFVAWRRSLLGGVRVFRSSSHTLPPVYPTPAPPQSLARRSIPAPLESAMLRSTVGARPSARAAGAPTRTALSNAPAPAPRRRLAPASPAVALAGRRSGRVAASPAATAPVAPATLAALGALTQKFAVADMEEILKERDACGVS